MSHEFNRRIMRVNAEVDAKELASAPVIPSSPTDSMLSPISSRLQGRKHFCGQPSTSEDVASHSAVDRLLTGAEHRPGRLHGASGMRSDAAHNVRAASSLGGGSSGGLRQSLAAAAAAGVPTEAAAVASSSGTSTATSSDSAAASSTSTTASPSTGESSPA